VRQFGDIAGGEIHQPITIPGSDYHSTRLLAQTVLGMHWHFSKNNFSICRKNCMLKYMKNVTFLQK
jgi:hypothetical protein